LLQTFKKKQQFRIKIGQFAAQEIIILFIYHQIALIKRTSPVFGTF